MINTITTNITLIYTEITLIPTNITLIYTNITMQKQKYLTKGRDGRPSHTHTTNLHEDHHNTPKSTKFTMKHARKPLTVNIKLSFT